MFVLREGPEKSKMVWKRNESLIPQVEDREKLGKTSGRDGILAKGEDKEGF